MGGGTNAKAKGAVRSCVARERRRALCVVTPELELMERGGCASSSSFPREVWTAKREQASGRKRGSLASYLPDWGVPCWGGFFFSSGPQARQAHQQQQQRQGNEQTGSPPPCALLALRLSSAASSRQYVHTYAVASRSRGSPPRHGPRRLTTRFRTRGECAFVSMGFSHMYGGGHRGWHR